MYRFGSLASIRQRLSFATLCALGFICGQAKAGDWVHWRGPTQNGVSYDTGLPEKFSLDKSAPDSNLIWTQPYGCRSTPIVMNGRVYIVDSAGEGVHVRERVMCFDADSGKVLWQDNLSLFNTNIVPSRVGWNSPVGDPETGHVFVHGTQGFMRCYDGDGKILWDHNLTEEYGRVSGYGGRIVGPTLDGNLVIVGMINGSWGDFARGATRFVAFDKNSGHVAWWTTVPYQIYYTHSSNPIVAVVNGERLLIAGCAGGGLHAMQVRTGKLVWSYQFAGAPIYAAPVVEGNYIYCSHGDNNLDVGETGRLICLDGSQVKNHAPKLVWEKVGTRFGLASPAVHDGVVYVCNDSARLYRFDAKTGKPIGRPTPYGVLARGSPVIADGKVYIFDVNGRFHILKLGKRNVEELFVQRFRPRRGAGFVETNGSPAIANGRIYFGTLEGLYCIGTKNGKAGSPPPEPEEDKGDNKIAQIQIFPADVVLSKGGSVELSIRAFNSNGVPLAAKPAGKWEIVLPPKAPNGRQPPKLAGQIVADGNRAKLTVSKTMSGQQGYVEFVSNGVTGRARVRVAPSIPYQQDFERGPVGATPGGWINTMGKFSVVEKDGGKALRKTATSSRPPLARANGYIGLPSMKNYTIQADLNSQGIRDGLCDMGLQNSRYRCFLEGKRDPDDNKRRLRISSYECVQRVNKAVVFDWKPDTWYTLKVQVEQTPNSAIVRGKVWERDQPEPKEWTVEFEDPNPNREGARRFTPTCPTSSTRRPVRNVISTTCPSFPIGRSNYPRLGALRIERSRGLGQLSSARKSI